MIAVGGTGGGGRVFRLEVGVGPYAGVHEMPRFEPFPGMPLRDDDFIASCDSAWRYVTQRWILRRHFFWAVQAVDDGDLPPALEGDSMYPVLVMALMNSVALAPDSQFQGAGDLNLHARSVVLRRVSATASVDPATCDFVPFARHPYIKLEALCALQKTPVNLCILAQGQLDFNEPKVGFLQDNCYTSVKHPDTPLQVMRAQSPEDAVTQLVTRQCHSLQFGLL